MNWWLLDEDHIPYQTDDMERVSEWAYGPDGLAHRRVAHDFLADLEISTVFLIHDHSFRPGFPILFETLVFGGPLADECVRYATWYEALEGHQKMVRRVETALRKEGKSVNRPDP